MFTFHPWSADCARSGSTAKLIGAMKIVATNPARVDYSYAQSDDKRVEAEKALLESVKADRQAKLDKALKALGDAKWGY